MSPVVHVSVTARAVFRTLDAALQTELLDVVARVAEDPAEMLTASRQGEAGVLDSYTGTYRSRVVEGLEVTLTFRGFFDRSAQPVLLMIAHQMINDLGADPD